MQSNRVVSSGSLLKDNFMRVYYNKLVRDAIASVGVVAQNSPQTHLGV